jgi:hypothetical protein
MAIPYSRHPQDVDIGVVETFKEGKRIFKRAAA